MDVLHAAMKRDPTRRFLVGSHADLLRCGEGPLSCSEVRDLLKMGIPDLDESSSAVALNHAIQSPISLRRLEGVTQHATEAPI